MDIVLIAMPWADATGPQASIGALAAYLAQREPSWRVSSMFAYLDVAAADLAFYQAIATADFEGERIYATVLYPEGADALAAMWSAIPSTSLLGRHLAERAARGRSAASVLAELRSTLERHIEEIVASRRWDDAVVGLTTSFNQLFANIALARRLKEVAPTATVVLGGSTVSPPAMADSVLATYPCVDYLVRGEGELPFHALCAQLAAGGVAGDTLPRGVVSRHAPAASSGMWQVGDLDALPMPDYDAYYARVAASAHGFLPIEGSRGCWWDRTTKKSTSTCKFCNLNVQWDGFRQKSATRIRREMSEQARRYRKSRFSFLDNIVRVKGYDELMDELGQVGLEPELFHEARANLRPDQILRFWDVGLRHAQFGIEGLSNQFLERINKGTSVVMNLEVMKTCAELGIRSLSNLIVSYPGSTEAEVRETVATIDAIAFAYEPPNVAPFELGIDSVVARFPTDNGVRDVRRHELYAAVIPAAVLATLQTFQLSFDHVDTADWTPVIERVARWRAEFRPGALVYEDGGSYLRVVRRRPNARREVFELVGEDAELYRFCTRYRSVREIHDRFAADSADHRAAIDATLERWVADALAYRHQDKLLAVAMAPDARIASKRIRTQTKVVPRRSPEPRRLAVVS